MYMTNKRQHSFKHNNQHRLQKLICEFNQQLKISSTTQKSFNSQKSQIDRLPAITQQQGRSRYDRFLSERLKYQHNLHTVIGQIKSKLQATQRYTFREPNIVTLQPSPAKQINYSQFKIKAINLSPEPKTKTNFTKSYVQACQKKMAQQKNKKRTRYQRFDFQPWADTEDIYGFQTIDL